mmetsp:Transcript_13511/g.36090  ORF Transcript_13511/g.36090 Transcript_13511/m.36090 type:complete len:190 (-) Transcript_13511:656-1225(-)
MTKRLPSPAAMPLAISVSRVLLLALGTLGAASGMRAGSSGPLQQSRVVTAQGNIARATSVPDGVLMSEAPGGDGGAAQERQRKRGRLATIDRVKPDKDLERKEKTEKEPIWRVLLHNDDVHTFDYVSMAITKVVKTVSRKKAFKITVEAHMSGIATVTTTWKAMAKQYCTGLQKMGLTSSIAPDPSMSQ